MKTQSHRPEVEFYTRSHLPGRRMCRTSLLLVTLLFSVVITEMSAQNKSIDSLKRALSEASDDQTRVQLNTYIGDEFRLALEHDSCAQYYKKALNIAEVNSLDDTYKIRRKLGGALQELGQHSLARFQLYKSLEESLVQNDSNTTTLAYENLANINQDQNDLSSSITLYNLAVRFTRDSVKLQKLNSNISLSYLKLKDYYKAIFFTREALQFIQDKDDYVSFSVNYTNLAESFIGLRQKDSALFYLEKSLALNLENEDSVGLVYDYHTRGRLHSSIMEYGKALKYYNLAVKLSDRMGYVEADWNGNEYLKCLDSIATTYQRIGKVDSAFFYSNKLKLALRDVTADLIATSHGEINLYEDNLKNVLENERIRRQTKIEYYAIFIGILIISLLYFGLSKYDKTRKYSKYASTLILIIFFEFLITVLDPWVTDISSNVNLYKFGLNIVVALIVLPVHSYAEKLYAKFVLDLRFKLVKVEEASGQAGND